MPKVSMSLLAALALPALLASRLPAQSPDAPKRQEDLRARQYSEAPKLLHRVDPVYPINAKLQGTEGAVTLRITISETGAVRQAEVLEGHPSLNDAAIAAVKQWRYTPPIVNGRPASLVTKATVDFVTPGPGRPGVQPPRRQPIPAGGRIPEGKRVYSIAPVYPPEAQQERISGTVELQLTLNEKGEVYQARVLRGHPLLDKAALAAAYQWRYSPTVLNGEPVPVSGTVEIIFKPRTSGVR